VTAPSQAPDAATLAAIVAAVDATWPRGLALPVPVGQDDASRWRFSARWWAQPTASRSRRPW